METLGFSIVGVSFCSMFIAFISILVTGESMKRNRKPGMDYTLTDLTNIVFTPEYLTDNGLRERKKHIWAVLWFLSSLAGFCSGLRDFRANKIASMPENPYP